MFACDQASFPINGVAVRVHRRLAVYAHVTVILEEAHDAVVGNVAEKHIAASREVNRSLGPTEPGCDALNRHGAGKGGETASPERTRGLLERFQVRIRIAAPTAAAGLIGSERPFGRKALRSPRRPLSWSRPPQPPLSPKMRVCSLFPPRTGTRIRTPNSDRLVFKLGDGRSGVVVRVASRQSGAGDDAWSLR